MDTIDCSLSVMLTILVFQLKGYRINVLMDDINESTERDTMAADGKTGWAMINDPTPAFRLIIMLGLFLSFAQQAVGIDAMQYLSLDILKASGIESEMTQDILLLVLAVTQLQCSFISARTVDNYGRQSLLSISITGKDSFTVCKQT